ncbi:hypothetical protein C8F04DRAFT_1275024 [Mycena alexandri]|uniref:Uncharacterized protein n=1 Tax=Mycena alexandri TaxID=1745969 RepID=A0AAD6S5X9_9AGAR|nr:hypothetical protein C8F04DRAFT_1275024 [Mycena alexandri]
MARPKSTLTREEVLERRAQAAWEYRQRYDTAIVPSIAPLIPVDSQAEKCHQREGQGSDAKTAPSAVQLEHTVKAAQYRRTYLERRGKATRPSPQTPEKPQAKTPSGKKTVPASSDGTTRPATPPRRALPLPPIPTEPTQGSVKPTARAMAKPKPKHPFRAVHHPMSPSPRSLQEIDADSDESPSEEDSDDESRYADDEDGAPSQQRKLERLGPIMGPLLNHTGDPSYVPLPGQTSYVKHGRRYWHWG